MTPDPSADGAADDELLEKTIAYGTAIKKADPAAKIHPFKYHEAKLPIDNATRRLIPIAVGMVFRAGKNEAATKAGAKAYFGREVTDIGWIETERWMGLFHEVVPRKDALACNACHSGGTRLDWKALGYPGDPMKVGARRVKAAATR